MFGHFGTPGQTSAQFTQDAEILWGGDESRIFLLRKDASISNAITDAGNTPTTHIRKGLLLGQISASGKQKQWDAVATDGSQELSGVLGVELLAVDNWGVAVERFAPIFLRAPVRANSLLIKGSPLVGHVDEYLARFMLHSSGFILDDDPQGLLAGLRRRNSRRVADYTILATDNGTYYLWDSANITATLPAIKPGLRFSFLRVSDHNSVVASAEGDNMIVGNDASADSITFSTAGQKIGASLDIEAIYVNGVLKWKPCVNVAPFGTGAFLTLGIAT